MCNKNNKTVKLIKKWLPRIFGCHCNHNRSFSHKGKYFPICARCTGELIGMFLTIPLNLISGVLDFRIYILLMLPLIIDGTAQMFTKYESTNIKRCLTGILFGYSFINMLIIIQLWTNQLASHCAKIIKVN